MRLLGSDRSALEALLVTQLVMDATGVVAREDSTDVGGIALIS